MTEGANSVSQICENSLTTLKDDIDPEELPPRTISHTTRRSRFGTGNVPLSPYILIDGRKLRSSLALSKKKLPRRVSFPTNDNHLITGYLEPANPWILAENANGEDLLSAYKESCFKHNSEPLETVVEQLENLTTFELRNDELNLRGQVLDVKNAEPLEEIFKRVQFDKVDLEATSLNDESSVILFDMLEYYESAKHLNISCNREIGIHGWQACANMIRKTQCLEHLEAKDVILNEQYTNILSRALRLVCHLHVLKLENCGLSGRSIIALVAALKMNTGIRELYLADNALNLYDSIQLGSLLRLNNHIQLLDISNNVIGDEGICDILECLINQINVDKDGKGLRILILWNNQLTCKSSTSLARVIGFSKTLETLNIGKNMLTDKFITAVKESLKKNHVLLQLGVQSTDLTCNGLVGLSDVIETNQTLQRIDLRNNSIQMMGIEALCSAMKKNMSITKIDLDDKPDVIPDDLSKTLPQYTQLLDEIRSRCLENEQNRAGFENSYHSQFCSTTTSRKISLTCQTLPRTLSSPISIKNDERSMLEPKRINGGRLRSPAPSPASSPVVSPILSPSRSRFVVSRVPETIRSTESSASSSPVVPSSPTSVAFATGSSRFRVSVVESANTVSLPKITTTEAEDDSTSGVNKLEKSAATAESRMGIRVENTHDTKENICTPPTPPSTPNEQETFLETIVGMKSADDNKEKNQQIGSSAISLDEVSTAAKEKTETLYRNEKSSTCTLTNDKSIVSKDKLTNESIESQVKHDPIQKSTSNLGKLLSLFQNSSCFFSDPPSINQLKSKNAFQGSINSMMTLGDKFHYYIKDKKDRIYNRETEEKSRSKFFNVSQLPALQSLASIIPSFRLEGNLNGPEQSDKPSSKETNPRANENEISEKERLDVCLKVQETTVSDNQLLLEDIKSKFPVAFTNKDVVLTANCIVSNIIETCSKIVNDDPTMRVSTSDAIVPVPKIIGIPDYSALKAARNVLQKRNDHCPLPREETNDPSLTDSINFTSDSNSLSCGQTYQQDDYCTFLRPQDTSMHNLVILNLSTNDNVDDIAFNVNSIGESNEPCFLRNREIRDRFLNDRSLDRCNTVKVNVAADTNRLNDQVTRHTELYSVDGDKYVSTRDDQQLERLSRLNNSTNRSRLVNNEANTSNVKPIRLEEDLEEKRSIEPSSYPTKGNGTWSIVLPLPKTINFNKLILRNLMRHVADISVNGIPVKRLSVEIIRSGWPNNLVQAKTLFCDLSQIGSRRNDRIIEENESETFRKARRNDAFVTECSSIDDPLAYSEKVEPFPKETTCGGDPKDIWVLGNFRSKCTNTDDRSDEYLNAIKRAVATSMCSTAAVNAMDNTTTKVDVVSDQSTNIAESLRR